MDAKRLVIGTVIGAITLSVSGILMFDLLLAGFYEANMNSAGVVRESQLFWSVSVGSILFALLIAIVIELQPRTKSIATGVLTGFIVGLLLWGTTDFTLYGIADLMTLRATLMDPVVEGIHAAIAGGMMTAVLGRMDGKPHLAM
jgi:predicted membrane protein